MLIVRETESRLFLQTDPIGFRAGDPNLYRYVNNEPIDWIDPFGLCRNKGESMGSCLDRKAHEFYGGLLDLADDLGYYGLGSAATGIATDLGTSAIEHAASESVKNSRLAGARTGGSLARRISAGQGAARSAARLATEKTALAALSKASGVLGAGATGFSIGARAAFIGECWEECPCPKDNSLGGGGLSLNPSNVPIFPQVPLGGR